MPASGSPFFARIERDVFAIVASVPAGRIVTFAAVGAYLDVMPRHVAYLLARENAELSGIPWHRAVPHNDKVAGAKLVGVGKPGRTRLQAERLTSEGVVVAANGAIVDFEVKQIAPVNLSHGVQRQLRPADAPIAKPRASRMR
jgi:methylated-DNA-protein-cysteine methyltransferase related protein